MPNNGDWHCIVHAFVECRARSGDWWMYARPTLPPDGEMAALLVGLEVDEEEGAVRALGVPTDVSLPVRDEYTWRVAGPTGGDAPNIVGADEAERWIARGATMRWATAEPFDRIIDPRWSHGTWLESTDLARLVERYEESSGQPAPSEYCALLAMMRELERDYIVRLVLWLERQLAAAHRPNEPHALPLRDHTAELERARVQSRLRRAKPRAGSRS
jgi:hypothetical protein